jgi:hypothetical protein
MADVAGKLAELVAPLACPVTALQIAEDNGMQRTSLCAAADAGRYAPLKRASPQSHMNGTRRNT